jgi:hypothetical protein
LSHQIAAPIKLNLPGRLKADGQIAPPRRARQVWRIEGFC